MPHKIFLLSPANLSGLRAKQLASPRAKFATALKYQSPEGVPIAEAFAFMSALYFRGKIAYARHFADPKDGVLIITSGYGLVPPEWPLNEERMKRMQKIDVDVASRSYTKPLKDHAKQLASMLQPDAGGAPRQRGHRQVRRSARADPRPLAALPESLRRSRRHGPRRPDAPRRARGQGARVHDPRRAAASHRRER
jgi:hypothetical protein